jgi:hypothetical protein
MSVEAVLFSFISWLFCKLWNSECLGATTKISGDFGINRDKNYIAILYLFCQANGLELRSAVLCGTLDINLISTRFSLLMNLSTSQAG